MQKLTKNILLMVMLASVALAQTTATKTAAKPTTGSTSTKATTTMAKPATKAPAVKSKVAAKPKPAPVKSAAAKPAPAKPAQLKESAATPKPRPVKEAPSKYASRRDPFINPVKMRQDKMSSAPACTTGARCLMIDQVVLKGVVKTQQGMIAMVENSIKKQYNLREKDPVYNGFVLKITGDSVVFKENIMDNMGRATTREVVKRVTVPVV